MEKVLEKIYLERGLESRPYQARNILDYISPEKPHVYAAATAAGKTYTTAAKLELYYRTGLLKEKDRVIILASDKTILRDNFRNQFKDFFESKSASFTWCSVQDKHELKEVVDNGTQVIIGLPQLIKDHTKLIKNIKWLVVDEAQKWYFAATIRGIIRDLKPKHQFLLTGTPFKFNLQRNNFIIDYTSVSSLYKMGYVDDVNLQVLHTSIALSRLDYVSMTDNLRANKRFSKKELKDAFREVVEQLIKKLKVPVKDLTTSHNITNNMMSLFGKLEKTIIFTHGINEADCLFEYLDLCGVKSLVSHSEDDQVAEETFNTFKKDKTVKVLVSVNRGREGFDFSELYNIIDMTYSQNFEVVMQMVGRLLRTSKQKTYKVFYKVAPKNTAGYFTDWMDCMIQLFDDHGYKWFNGRNTLDIRVPNVLLNRPKQPRTPMYIQDGKDKIEISGGTSFQKGTKITVLDKNFKKVPLKNGKYEIPQEPTNDNPKPVPIKIEVKAGVITKTTQPNTRGRITPKNLQSMGFDNSLSFMEKNDWFRLDDPLSTVATTTLRKIIYQFDGVMDTKHRRYEIYKSFKECREYVWKLNLTSKEEYLEYGNSGKLPEYIPTAPYNLFKDEWLSWPDWIGTKIGYKGTADFIVVDEFIKKNKLNRISYKKLYDEGKLPQDFPKKPEKIYEEFGSSWSVYLGGDKRKIQNWTDKTAVEEAKKYTSKDNLAKKSAGCFKYIKRRGLENIAFKHMINPTKKSVLQYDLEGNFIKKYDSVSDASMSLINKPNSTINHCVIGKTKSAYGFMWKYEE
jgi:superfamily II DNA or RNA helicase